MVIFAIRLQEQAGLDVVSDGEWRRVHYADEFLNRIGGFERVRVTRPIFCTNRSESLHRSLGL